MTSTPETFVLLCYGEDFENKARIISAYLNEQFILCSDYPSTVEQTTDHEFLNGWNIHLPIRMKQYTTTLEKIRTSAQDFWNGYTLAMKEST